MYIQGVLKSQRQGLLLKNYYGYRTFVGPGEQEFLMALRNKTVFGSFRKR